MRLTEVLLSTVVNVQNVTLPEKQKMQEEHRAFVQFPLILFSENLSVTFAGRVIRKTDFYFMKAIGLM